MSDQSQGEGWWIASDGKWYPPESHPDATSPSPEPADAVEAQASMPPPTGDPTPLDPPTEQLDPTLQQPVAAAAAAADYPDDETKSTERSTSSGALIAAFILLALVIAGAIYAVVLLNDDDESGDDVAVADTTSSTTAQTTSTNTSTSTTTSTSTSTTTTQPTTTTTEVQDGESIDNPAPLAGARFVWSETGNDWDTETFGLLKVRRDRFAADEAGSCFLLLGTLTPTEIAQGSISSGFSAPNFGSIASGRYIDSAIGECDSARAEKAGYGWILDAEVTAGTVYPFFTEIFIPGDPAAPIDSIVAGQPTGDDALYFTPDEIDEIPEFD